MECRKAFYFDWLPSIIVKVKIIQGNQLNVASNDK